MSRSACGVDGGSARRGKEDGPRRQAPAPAGVTAGGGWSAGTRAVPRVSWRASPGRAAKVSPAPRSTTLPRHGRRVNGVVCVLCSPAPHCSAFTGTAAILLLPPPDHPACAPCHRPHPWQGPALVPLPGHSLVHGLHEGLLMRRFYPYMSVRTALSASWPHTNPQPAFHTENLGGVPREPRPRTEGDPIVVLACVAHMCGACATQLDAHPLSQHIHVTPRDHAPRHMHIHGECGCGIGNGEKDALSQKARRL